MGGCSKQGVVDRDVYKQGTHTYAHARIHTLAEQKSKEGRDEGVLLRKRLEVVGNETRSKERKEGKKED